MTAGLIRHYFQSKEELIRAAYRALMDGMIEFGADAVRTVGAAPEARLAAFVADFHAQRAAGDIDPV